MKLSVALLVVVAGCQSNVSTPFPPGLEPLEDNPVTLTTVQEGLVTQTTSSPYVKIYGKGYVLAPPATVWAVSKSPAPNVAACSTNKQDATENNDPDYEYSFLVHYTVNNILTVEWDDQWRFGTVHDEPFLGMIKHQKTQGSDFIHRSEGTIQIVATDDPNVTELQFVEHLDAVSGGVSDVLKGTKHNYDALVALSHGNPIPACP